MKKNDIFTFIAPNGAEVTAVVIDKIHSSYHELEDTISIEWLCYAQSRLFTYNEKVGRKNVGTPEEKEFTIKTCYGKVLVDYALLPCYADLLDRYSDHLVTMTENQSGM